MGPGGCDKTKEMIEEWIEKIKGLLSEETPKTTPTTDEGLRNKYKHILL